MIYIHILYFRGDGGPLEPCSGGSISQSGEWSCDIHSPRCSPPPIALQYKRKPRTRCILHSSTVAQFLGLRRPLGVPAILSMLTCFRIQNPDHLYSLINHPRIIPDPSNDILPKRGWCHMVMKNTKTKTMTMTNTFREHLQRAILETCDLWDIWSEWWEDLTWPKNDSQKLLGEDFKSLKGHKSLGSLFEGAL